MNLQLVLRFVCSIFNKYGNTNLIMVADSIQDCITICWSSRNLLLAAPVEKYIYRTIVPGMHCREYAHKIEDSKLKSNKNKFEKQTKKNAKRKEATDKIMKKKEEEELRRNEIRKLLQRHGQTIRSLQSLSEKETSHEEVTKKKEEEELQRNEMRKFLQHHGKSIRSLQTLSDKENRHEEENCSAIPEGNEDKDEDDEDDHDTDKEEIEGGEEDKGNADEDNADVYDSIEKTTLSLLSKSMTAWIDIDDDSESNSNSNYDTENEGDQQIQPKHGIFHRMTRFVVMRRKTIT